MSSQEEGRNIPVFLPAKMPEPYDATRQATPVAEKINRPSSRRRMRTVGIVGTAVAAAAVFGLGALGEDEKPKTPACTLALPQEHEAQVPGISVGLSGELPAALGEKGLQSQHAAWDNIEKIVVPYMHGERFGVVAEVGYLHGSPERALQAARKLTQLASQELGMPTVEEPEAYKAGQDDIGTLHLELLGGPDQSAACEA